jgi:hypothetical protein
MTMDEARWNIRIPLEIDVRLRIAPAVHLKARTRDVSFEGMLVAMSLPRTARNAPVIVRFDAEGGPLQATAVIVRTGPEGTGLMFTGDNDAVADALALLMESELDRLLLPTREGAARPFSR